MALPIKPPKNKNTSELYGPHLGFSPDFGRQTSFERLSISSSPVTVCNHPYPAHNLGLDKDPSEYCCDNLCEEACGDCCDDEDCPAEPCAEAACSSIDSSSLHSPCAGFVDCDDKDPCTRPECGAEECREVAPPCFNSGCLEGLMDNVFAATYNLATDGLLSNQDNWFTTAGEAALNPVRGGETSSSDLEYQFEHTGALGNHLDQTHLSQGGGDLDANGVGWVDGYPYPPAKRRRTLESNNNIEFDRLPLQLPLEQQAQTQINGTSTPIHCQWGEHCDQSFFDWNTLEGHIQSTHITSQYTVQCHWNGCEEPTHPSMVLNHVKRKHDFEDQHVCLWGGCSQVFSDHTQLEQHLKNAHAPPNSLLCEWGQCGVVAEDPLDLKEHLQLDHCFDPRFMTLGGQGRQPSSASSSGVERKTCAWTVGDDEKGEAITCGLIFDNAEALHEHIKAAHTDRLNQKLGYFCQWKDCDRRGHGRFSQKGKLERHVQVHTGCMWLPTRFALYQPC